MNTYEIEINTTFAGKECIEKTIISPDPKREGMYKSSRSYSNDGFKRKRIDLYGKCNQPALLEKIKKAKKVV